MTKVDLAADDLIRRRDVLSICKEIADTSVEYIFSEREPDHSQRREAMEATATSIRYAVANLPAAVSSASPPPGEDLAGQGEPVADIALIRQAAAAGRFRIRSKERSEVADPDAGMVWPIEIELPCINGLSCWFAIGNLYTPDAVAQGYTDGALSDDLARAFAAHIMGSLYAAPAPSRPADREEIARKWWDRVCPTDWKGQWDKWKTADLKLARQLVQETYDDADAILALALRDAPRDAGDGWRPIETAPKDGTLIGVAGGCAVWSDHGQKWLSAMSGSLGHPIQWEVTHWKSLDPATIPPSPNPTDGTQDTDQGGK